jgi:hypothetical protein
LYLFFYAFIFHLLNFTNIALVDYGEEPVRFREPEFIISAILVAVFFYFYLRYLTGNTLYRKVKEVVWGIFFGSTALFCTIWMILSYLVYGEKLILNYVVLGLYIAVSTGLAVMTVVKFRDEGDGRGHSRWI